MDENVKNKWAQVENQLKRRYDLIPNLVETISLQLIATEPQLPISK